MEKSLKEFNSDMYNLVINKLLVITHIKKDDVSQTKMVIKDATTNDYGNVILTDNKTFYGINPMNLAELINNGYCVYTYRNRDGRCIDAIMCTLFD